jgi:hypothetical protein
MGRSRYMNARGETDWSWYEKMRPIWAAKHETPEWQAGYPCTAYVASQLFEAGRTCVHLSCGIEAGLRIPLMAFNAVFQDQLYHNWLRFDLDNAAVRRLRARTYWLLKRRWKETGELDIMTCVWTCLTPKESIEANEARLQEAA